MIYYRHINLHSPTLRISTIVRDDINLRKRYSIANYEDASDSRITTQGQCVCELVITRTTLHDHKQYLFFFFQENKMNIRSKAGLHRPIHCHTRMF